MDRENFEVSQVMEQASEEAAEEIICRIDGRWYRKGLGYKLIPTLPPLPSMPREFSGRIVVRNPWTGTPGAVV